MNYSTQVYNIYFLPLVLYLTLLGRVQLHVAEQMASNFKIVSINFKVPIKYLFYTFVMPPLGNIFQFM